MFKFISKDKDVILSKIESTGVQANKGGIYDTELTLLKHNQDNIVNRLGNKIEETAFAAENLIALTNNISQNVEVQMESIEKVINEINNYSALAEEVFASTENSKQIADQTVEIAKGGSDAVHNSIQAMKDIENAVEESKQVVKELNIKASSINEMLVIIKDIASHTNLLSLNASIEAARAGEAGRGFAVVAQEVKNLAQRSAESAGKIAQTIEEINLCIDKTINAMNKSMRKVVEGTQIANNTVEVFNNIINAVRMTSNVTEDINEAVSKQTSSLEEIITSAENMNITSEKVMGMVESASLNTQYTKTSLNLLSNVSKDLKVVSGKLLDKITCEDKENIELKTYIAEAPLTYDPAMAFDQQSAQILYNTNTGLLLIGATGEITPGVAKSWYVEDDNVTWNFNLRKGAKFHNGKEITAEDIKYSYERLLSPELKSPNSWFLYQIEGAEEFNNGRAKDVKGIKIIDRYRLSIRLLRPYSGFLLNLGQCVCSILSKEDGQKGKLTGCGPFIMEKSDKEGCVLKAFNDYFGGSPYIDRIIVTYNGAESVKSFLNNECDFITFEDKQKMEELTNAKVSNINLISVMGTYYAGFNLRSNSMLVKNPSIKKAINYAVNKKKIISELLGGMGEEAKGPFPPNMVDNKYLEGFSYNPKLAKELINKNSSVRTNEKLKVLVRDDNNVLFNKIADYIINDLKEIGVECTVERVPSENYLKPESINQADLFLSRWISDTGDMDNFLQPMFNPDNYTDFTGYNNSNVTEAMDKAKEIVNPQKRMEMYKNIQNIIIENTPWIYLYHPQIGYVSRRGVLGLRVSPLGIVRYDDIIVEQQ
ncbi:methyl-accepting chemotaxis protein signaling domain protein [Clostridiales bacterium oral taxon 876 str. F0540]|nr:methyl-accepting chemotaxis protein signaling domain protein [Clostridiales bacterium oral taxon 876 str. F0540]